MACIKTGECYFVEADGSLWVAESYEDVGGVVDTKQHQVAPAQPTLADCTAFCAGASVTAHQKIL